MYIPACNRKEERVLLLEAMRANSFALLCGPAKPPLTATHLPLTILDEGPHGVLEGHFAQANPQASTLAGEQVLVVFSGPHAYVSPRLYEKASVPTWNYIAVHAYGRLELLEDDATKEAMLAGMFAVYEPESAALWAGLGSRERAAMLRGIVGFRIAIERIEGKFKLSQNRPPVDRQSVRDRFAAGNEDERALAAWMDRLEI